MALYQREQLLEAVTIASKFAAPNKLLPIHNYMAFIDNMVMAFDGHRGIIFITELDFGQEGFLLPATGAGTTIGEILNKLDEESTVDVSLKGDQITIKSGSFKSDLKTLPFTDFIQLTPPEESLELDPAFLTACGKVKYCICKDETKPGLMGIQYRGGKLLACDNYRFASTPFPIEGVPEGFLFPSHTLEQLSSLAEDPATFTILQNQVWFGASRYIVFGQLYSVVPPDLSKLEEKFRALQESSEVTVKFNSKQLTKAVARVRLFSESIYNVHQIDVSWNPEEGLLSINCHSEAASGVEQLAVEGPAEPFKFSINAPLFEEAVERYSTMTVTPTHLFFSDQDVFHALCCLMPK